MKILIDAYFNENVGDDCFVRLLCRRYPDIEFYAWSKYSLDEPNLHTYYQRLENRLLSRERIYKRHFHFVDAVVQIGGSMFMEGISRNPDLSILKKPWFLIGANFGPFTSRQWLEEHRMRFMGAVDLCFRDEYSAALFKENGARAEADLIFQWPVDWQQPKEKKAFVALKDLEDENYFRFFSEQIKLLEKDYKIILCAFCPAEGDQRIALRLQEQFPQAEILSYQSDRLPEILTEMATSEIVLASRLHAILLGLLAGARVLPFAYSKKTERILSDLELGEYINFDNLSQKAPVFLSLPLHKRKALRESALRQFLALDEFVLSSRQKTDA